MPLTRVERAAIRLAEQLGFEWVDLELVKEPAGRFLRFYVDKEGGITLDGLARGACRELPLEILGGVLDGGL